MTVINAWLPAGKVLPRHQHAKPYITLVVRGRYHETGDQGRFRVGPGDILVHGAFASHANAVFADNDITTLNIEVDEVPDSVSACTTPEFDTVVRLSASDPAEAVQTLTASLQPRAPLLEDWPDIIAKGISDDPVKPIGYWCQKLGLASSTVSRGFKRAFGVSAAHYRATSRARKAYHALTHSNLRLVEIAGQCGYADQAHFTRAIRTLTGAPPSYWRQVKYLQDGDFSQA